MLRDREEIREDLGGVELVGQAVPDGNAGEGRQLLDPLLPEAPVLDAVEHAPEHTGGIRDALLLPDLGGFGIEVDRVYPEIRRRHFKAAAGAGAGLLEDQRDILAPVQLVGDAGLFLRLQLRRQRQQPADLLRREIQQLEKAFAFQIHCPAPFTPHRRPGSPPPPFRAAPAECSAPAGDGPCPSP